MATHLLLGEVIVCIFEPERDNLQIRSAKLFPVGCILIKHSLDLGRCQFPDIILPVQGKNISLFYNLFLKKTRPLGKEKSYDKQDDDARYESACGKHPFYSLFNESLHTGLQCFIFLHRNKTLLKHRLLSLWRNYI